MYKSLNYKQTEEAVNKCTPQLLRALIHQRNEFLDILAQEFPRGIGNVPEHEAIYENSTNDIEAESIYLVF